MTGNKFDKDLIAFIYVTVLAIIAVIYTLTILPDPLLQREINFDQQRVSDIQQLQSQIENYYNDKDYLPTNLDELVNSSTYYGNGSTKDPLSKKAYEYTILSSTMYQLCGDFTTDSDLIKKYTTNETTNNYYYSTPMQMDKFKHPIGHYCFESSVIPRPKYDYQYPAITPICLGNNCQEDKSSGNSYGSPSVYPTNEPVPTFSSLNNPPLTPYNLH